jgi:UDP-arabinose 4-epimerase
MNILVTGGAGYIGSHAAKALAQAGHTPIVYDNLSRGHEWAVRWGPLVKGDIGDIPRVKATINRYGIEAVLHFAAYAYVGESMADPGKYFENNSVASLRLLQAVHETKVRFFVFSSSCATYGIPNQLPINEDHPQHPSNPYGESKLFVEKFLRWYGEIHGIKWVALRYFNACGADLEGDIGELHQPETHLIPLLIESCSNPNQPVPVFGVDYPTRDGTAIRDYVHVTDLAAAHVAALEYLVAGGAESRAFNLGTGVGYSVLEVSECIKSVTGLAPALIRSGRRPGDPAILIADPRLAHASLGWQARHSGLVEIVTDAWKFQSGRRSLIVGAERLEPRTSCV